MKTTPALCISLGPSRSASALICVAWLATDALITWLPGAAALRGALVIGIGAHATLTMQRLATRSATPMIARYAIWTPIAPCASLNPPAAVSKAWYSRTRMSVHKLTT